MSEEELEAIAYLRKVRDKNLFLFCNDIRIVLNLITKQQNKIEDVKTRLEYYLMGNLSFNNEAQKEFEKLLKMLEE